MAAVLFFLEICIAVFYILFSVEYIFNKTIVTDAAMYTSLLVCIATASVFYFFIVVRATGFEQDKIVCLLQNGIRYFLAFIFFYYAFIKICGNMFSTSLATLDTPLYQLSGFQLTWRFFGYSPVYNWLVICFQLLCGSLLLFRRTTLAGCLLGFGMMLNISAINFTHHIHLKLLSVIYTVMLLYFILLHFDGLIVFVFHQREKNISLPAPYLTRQTSFSALVIKFFLIATSIICFYKEWKMKNKFSSKSPVQGVWVFKTPHTGLFSSADKIIFDTGNEGLIKTTENEETAFSYTTDTLQKQLLIAGIAGKSDTTRLKYTIVAQNHLQLKSGVTIAELEKEF